MTEEVSVSVSKVNLDNGVPLFENFNFGNPVEDFKPKETGVLGPWAKPLLEDMITNDSASLHWGLADLNITVVGSRAQEDENKKYISYAFRVNTIEDSNPAILERRYTDFLNLYNALQIKYPTLMVEKDAHFPRKVLMGNFSDELRNERAHYFLEFLKWIVSNSQIRVSNAVVSFLQEKELKKALNLIKVGKLKYHEARPLVEYCFILLNKFLTAREPDVLKTLCLLASIATECGDGDALKLATLAVYRFQSVSDIDLLRYYVPLLVLTSKLCEKYGKDSSTIEAHLASLKRRGMANHLSTPLLELLMQDYSKS